MHLKRFAAEAGFAVVIVNIILLAKLNIHIFHKHRSTVPFGTKLNNEALASVTTIRPASITGSQTATTPASHNNSCIFANYDIHSPPLFYLQEDTRQYFTTVGDSDVECLSEGMNYAASKNATECICRNGWWGPTCSYPHALKHQEIFGADVPKLKRRKTPRRIIIGHPFSVEFEMTEARFAEIGDLVDVFLISESNYSAHGDPKPTRLLNRLRQGFWAPIQNKIVYVYIGYFPKGAYSNGWLADDLSRDALGEVGMVKLIKNARHDDLFLHTDTDELPQRDVLLFLKLYDGYPELFGFHLKRTTYGFFWLAGNGHWSIMGGSTVGVLSHIFDYKASHVRNPAGHLPKARSKVAAYIKAGGNLKQWKLGDKSYHVGWHCSWCFGVPEIRIKLLSAFNADFPRWGDYPEKQNLTYIRGLVKKGMWFDDKSTMKAVEFTEDRYAPQYLLLHEERFKHILHNPFQEG